jgi:hypothetical protein
VFLWCLNDGVEQYMRNCKESVRSVQSPSGPSGPSGPLEATFYCCIFCVFTYKSSRRNMPSCTMCLPMIENEDVVVVAKRKRRSTSVHRMHDCMRTCCSCNGRCHGARSRSPNCGKRSLLNLRLAGRYPEFQQTTNLHLHSLPCNSSRG